MDMIKSFISSSFFNSSSDILSKFFVNIIFWSTYKLKKSDIRIVTEGFNRAEAAALRQEILDSINAHEREHKEAIDAHRNSTNKALRRNASRKKS